ncbi:helix-turn-helix domain-containing protein [Pusillimonas sp. CC-YST705]|uniref:citrate synthase (unknown stereospecificity) n=1 Tax=Mesopusillimonas faecipullorum TaxID=2755040 RepID=A0ABS8CFQ7_9BURK|nr:citrate synthase [Mesopusillimonas faecipullorum]MCB5364872.1 helix-turn-helix domain-containing protein [Mesopusillimonas faecipullorum]
MTDYLTASEAMERLGVKQQTLYAYVSRQLIRRITAPGAKRSLYSREDVEKLAARRASNTPGAAAMPAWQADSSSSLSTALTQITPEGPMYRGRLFSALAAYPGRIENVAELLWTGLLLDEPLAWEHDDIPANMEGALAALQLPPGQVPFLRAMATVSIVMGEPAGKELRSGSTAGLARRLVCAYAGCLGMLTPQAAFVRPQQGETVAHIVLRALNLAATPEHLAAINAVLITCADHDLSSPTYAARVVASTGAGLHACLLASIAGHSGQYFGGSCDRTEDLWLAAPEPGQARAQMAPGIQPGTRLPGFQHPLYAAGDPRAQFLLRLAEQLVGPQALEDIYQVIRETETATGQRPALELGLVAVARALGLPRRGASALWAVGRSVGWVAHVIEQRLAGQMIRPQGRYDGR